MNQKPREDLDDLYENAPCGFLSLGSDGCIVKSNRTFSAWIGHEPEYLLGKRLRDLLNISGQIFYETHFAPLLRMQGFFNEVALDLVRSDGQSLQVLANAAERRDASNALMFTRITLFQATERRRYERDLVTAKETAQSETRLAHDRLSSEHETAKLREQFIAVLGHDLRNPLAAIDGGINLLTRQPQSDKSLAVISLMQDSALRMNDLIGNILDFARGRLGEGLSVSRSERPLRPTLEQVVSEIRTTYPDRTIEIDVDPNIVADADHPRLAQMFSNLLANAVAHGEVDRPIRIAGKIEAQQLELSISNSGRPIPPESLERLFQPFFRGDANSPVAGLGLGLYISSQIAQAHAGSLVVHSDERETRFTFRLPAPSV